MLQFEKSLRDEGLLSSGYCCFIKKLFTEARLHYNDNAEGDGNSEFKMPKVYE